MTNYFDFLLKMFEKVGELEPFEKFDSLFPFVRFQMSPNVLPLPWSVRELQESSKAALTQDCKI